MNPEAILQAVSAYYRVHLSRLRGPERAPLIAFPRMVAAYLLRRYTRLSLPKIGALLGGRHHTTILHAIRRVEDSLDLIPMLRSFVEGFNPVIEIAIARPLGRYTA